MATNSYTDYQLKPYTNAAPNTAANVAVPDLGGYSPTTGNASTGILARWSVDGNQLVEDRLNNMLTKGSAYRDMAETGAKQQMNARGLLNSSLAATAGHAAAIQSALPIAQQDAQTFSNAGQFNAGQENSMNQFNAGQSQNMTLANMDATNAADQYGAQQRNTSILKNAEFQQDTTKFNAQQANAISEANAGRSFEASKTQLQADVELFNTVTDSQTKTAVADIEARYNVLMQASASASEMYQQMIKNISDISVNKDLKADAKSTAIQNQITMLNSGMQFLSVVNDLDLVDILDFGVGGQGDIGLPGTTTPRDSTNAPGIFDDLPASFD